MKPGVKSGDTRIHQYTVTEEDYAAFESGTVHEVCSTYVLGREIEWSSRLFVLDMRDDDEEGIGTSLEIIHHAPAFKGEELSIEATVTSLQKNELICAIKVMVGDRLIATGSTGQKILKKDRIRQIFTRLDR